MEHNPIRKEINSIELPKELNRRIMEGFIQAEQEMNNQSLKKKGNRKKYITLWFSAAIIFIGLFVGSSFVSPTIASIVSKMPLFHNVFNRGPIVESLMNHLIKQGYTIKGLSQTKNTISVSIDPKQYSEQKKEVEKAAKQYIQQQGYSNIEIKVKKYSGSKVIKNVTDYPLENSDFIIEISKKMAEAGFDTKYNQYQTKPKPAELTLVIPERDYKTRKNDIIQIVKEVGDAFDVGTFKISFNTFKIDNLERKDRWTDIISTLNEVLLNYKEYPINSFGSSINDNVRLYVQLDILRDNPSAKEKAKVIEQEIREFLSSPIINKVIKDDHYKIEITSKDKKRLN
ncbi:DUF4030 domain-containing protein [Heyndrickxia camelliae]|uniref:DUF4179 domain-containing protein n=1 Tax=Heyndrickxia camelliae TaxID=1707093 RepID=A0A2N3LM55_9BACI|nr:DUF4030 domain-containing protein [Heyndrickxia camelliae]PKR85634.1 hypothetical protein CWO92_07950 [Heyndrickxia camelliae]